MSVLFVCKWNINPDKTEEYAKWAQSAIQRQLAVPGVVEFRAYRGVTGDAEVITNYEFSDIVSWASWRDNDDVQKVTNELFSLALNVRSELWGPSPVVPKPIRPRG